MAPIQSLAGCCFLLLSPSLSFVVPPTRPVLGLGSPVQPQERGTHQQGITMRPTPVLRSSSSKGYLEDLGGGGHVLTGEMVGGGSDSLDMELEVEAEAVAIMAAAKAEVMAEEPDTSSGSEDSLSPIDSFLVTMGFKKDPNLAKDEEEVSVTDKIKAAGAAGVVAYAFTEGVFWFVSLPLAVGAYVQSTGHLPDFADAADKAELAAFSFGFLTLARAAVPARIAFALALVPFVEKNVLTRFGKKEEEGV